MINRTFGTSGLMVSAIGLGCMGRRGAGRADRCARSAPLSPAAMAGFVEPR